MPEEFIDVTEKLAQNIFIATATHSQYAALAAFDPQTLAELEHRRVEFEARRDFLYDALLRLGFEIPIKPDGAFYIYANCSKFTDDSYQFALDLLEAAPQDTFYTDDRAEFIEKAYNLGIRSFVFRDAEQLKRDFSGNGININ